MIGVPGRVVQISEPSIRDGDPLGLAYGSQSLVTRLIQ